MTELLEQLLSFFSSQKAVGWFLVCPNLHLLNAIQEGTEEHMPHDCEVGGAQIPSRTGLSSLSIILVMCP